MNTRDIYLETYFCSVCICSHVEYDTAFGAHYNNAAMGHSHGMRRGVTKEQHRKIIARRIKAVRATKSFSRDYKKGKIDEILRNYHTFDLRCSDCPRGATINYFGQIPVCAEHFNQRVESQYSGTYDKYLAEKMETARKLK